MTRFIGEHVKISTVLRAMVLAGMLPIATNSFAAEIGGVEFSGSGCRPDARRH